MQVTTFNGGHLPSYKCAILTTRPVLEDIDKYLLSQLDLTKDEIVCFSLYEDPVKKKTPKKVMEEFYVTELLPEIVSLGVEYLLIADAEYFKLITKQAKADAMSGYVVPTRIDSVQAVYSPNLRSIFYNPSHALDKIRQATEALNNALNGVYEEPGIDIIRYAHYPETDQEIEDTLNFLHEYPALTVDVETFDLKHYKSGLGTISFSWNKHEGTAFLVDYEEVPVDPEDKAPFYGQQTYNKKVRSLLTKFFTNYKGKLIFHNSTFDSYILVYQLFMKDLLDQKGLLKGLELIMRDNECTKIISFLATNTCAGNKLSLKEQAQEFAGNYAMEDDSIKDIRLIPRAKLLEYNLIDTLSTWYTYDKNLPIMIDDDQETIYETILKPAMKDVVQMQLSGMPLNMDKVKEAEIELQKDYDSAVKSINKSKFIKETEHILARAWAVKRNTELKVKRVTAEDFNDKFNPASPLQLQTLLYDVMELPVLEVTATKQPSTGNGVLKNLKNHTKDKEILALLDHLIDFKDVEKILGTFIPPMLAAPKGKDGWHYLFGFFNLGGTVSGRLSSNGPNLQQIPNNGSRYGPIIKRCFEAPDGYLFVGLDFDSLEDKISAVTTKDTNKVAVYTKGYDGHSFRCYNYWPERFTTIPNTVNGINSIKKLFPLDREDSKAPTFLLTYQGTYHGLMKNCGFSKEEAMAIEENFKILYKESVEFIKVKLIEASKVGYVVGAFGLRARTPLLHQVVLDNRKTPREAESEGRTAGNFLGQSWCILNTKAASTVMGQVRQGEYAEFIKPCSQIHDAQYYLIKDSVDIVEYINKLVVDASYWQDHPDIYHPDIKLGGSLDLFFPDWSKGHTLAHNMNQDEIMNFAVDIIEALNER